MNLKSSLLVTALLSATCLTLVATAQPEQVQPEQAQREQEHRASNPFGPARDGMQWKRILVRNVSPSLMAAWLDPVRGVVREEHKTIKPDWAHGRDDAEVAAMLSLPTGVWAVTALDRQNVVWALGSEAGHQKLAEKVALLDTPLRQLEVETQWVQISEDRVKALGINFEKTDDPTALGLVEAPVRSQIQDLIAQNKARILSAPRVTVVRGSTASLFATTSRPAVIGIRSDDGTKFQELFDAGETQKTTGVTPVAIGTSFGLNVTPTLDSEENITLQMGPYSSLILSDETSKVQLPLKALGNMPPVIKLKDAQTVAIKGLTLPQTSFPAKPAKTPAPHMLVLVTARIIRRAP
jgi:type II secretory pathway component GspD/PulD (secretin)